MDVSKIPAELKRNGHNRRGNSGLERPWRAVAAWPLSSKLAGRCVDGIKPCPTPQPL